MTNMILKKFFLIFYSKMNLKKIIYLIKLIIWTKLKLIKLIYKKKFNLIILKLIYFIKIIRLVAY